MKKFIYTRRSSSICIYRSCQVSSIKSQSSGGLKVNVDKDILVNNFLRSF
jgi:hypothetical protein